MSGDKKRKELNLDRDTIAILSIQAEKEGRNLKNYMEDILKDKANCSELNDEYKLMIDKKLQNHKIGELDYISEEEFRKQTSR
ncbi:hypothetical protein A9Q93_09480 [Nonlabens dokdonensis]|uniref:Toxin-antitoxin system, antitoxin component, ribbon-helix-helix domain protein n=1 Tax=Nonlabens dokdonensis TaxID=328515 RepID=A0A1Z8ASL2_9FLAO|nr:hypothetical protein [Nonlabens dokdonensis]OUS13342.1 hypothetical protein A9Q93_09480 [Nonlabens dokdonensis]